MKKNLDKQTSNRSFSENIQSSPLEATFDDQRSSSQVQLKQIDAIHNSTLMAKQMKRLGNFGGLALQKMEGLDEEELQKKADPLQKMEGLDEEELQKKADPLQKMEGLDEEELQKKADPLQKMEGLDEEELQKKADPLQKMEGLDEEELQKKADPLQKMDAKPIQREANSTGMPGPVKSQMEGTFKQDFSDVKIHENSSKAPDVGALAYAQGKDLHFAPGQFKPETTKGQELLGHELTHVVQQSEGRVKPTTEVMGMPVNDDPKLEAEADQMGKKAAQAKKK